MALLLFMYKLTDVKLFIKSSKESSRVSEKVGSEGFMGLADVKADGTKSHDCAE
jgi:hypothetical protein